VDDIVIAGYYKRSVVTGGKERGMGGTQPRVGIAICFNNNDDITTIDDNNNTI